MKAVVRLGVVGYGKRSHAVVTKALRGADPEVRVVGIVDPDEAGVRLRMEEADKTEAVFYKTLPEMVRRAKLDGLVIGTACHLHTPYAIQAARYDIPLFLEKPVATSIRQGLALEHAFAKSKCEVVVSFPYRMSPLCGLACERIAQGGVGTPEHISAVDYAVWGSGHFEEGPGFFNKSQGLFLHRASHDFDYMSLLMGSPIVRVAAMTTEGHVFGGRKKSGLTCAKCKEQETCPESPQNRRRNRYEGGWGDHPCTFGVDCGTPQTGMCSDSASALVEFASGAHGVFTQVVFARRDAAARGATVSGYKGIIKFDWFQNTLQHVRHHVPINDLVKRDAGPDRVGGDTALGLHFLACIKGAEKSRSPLAAGLQSVYVGLAAKESAATGRFVKVRPFGGE